MRVGNFRPETTVKFAHLQGSYAMRGEGRWGPRWLHRLVWRMAMNLGMIGHPTVMESVTVWRPVMPKELKQYIAEAVLGYLNQDFYRQDLVCFTGHDAWRGAIMDRDFMGSGMITEEFWTHGGAGGRMLGLPVYVLPQMKGALVVPRPKLEAPPIG